MVSSMPAMSTASRRRLRRRAVSLTRRFARKIHAEFSPEETMPWRQAADRAVAAPAMQSLCARVETFLRTLASASAAVSGMVRRRSASLQWGRVLVGPTLPHLLLCRNQKMEL